jgi:hypothetical protein
LAFVSTFAFLADGAANVNPYTNKPKGGPRMEVEINIDLKVN